MLNVILLDGPAMWQEQMDLVGPLIQALKDNLSQNANTPLAPFLYLLHLMTYLISLANLSTFLSNLISIMISSIIYLLIIIAAVMFLQWVYKKEGIIIQPFEIGSGIKNCSGKAISHLLKAELMDIKRIYQLEFEDFLLFEEFPSGMEPHRMEIKLDLQPNKEIDMSDRDKLRPNKEKESFDLAPLDASLIYTVSEPISAGPFSVPLGSLLIFVKRFFPFSEPLQTITCSLEKYGKETKLVACMEHQMKAWILPEKTQNDQENLEVKDIPNLLKDLAFNIIKDSYLEKNVKTWSGLKNYIEAKNAFHQYTSVKDMNKLDESMRGCLDAIKVEPSYESPIKLIHTIGLIYLNKDRDKAKELYQEIVKHKQDILSYLMLWALYTDSNSGQEADKAYKKAFDIIPIKAQDWYNRGTFQLFYRNQEEDFKKAIGDFEEAIKLDPYHYKAWNNKGIAYANLGKYEDACRCYNKAINVNKKYAIAWNNKGAALSDSNKYERAIEAYDSAIKINPKWVEPWSGKGLVWITKGLDWNKEGEALLKEAEKKNSDGNKKGAIKNQKKAIQKFDVTIKFFDEAIQIFEKASKMNPNEEDFSRGKNIALKGKGKIVNNLGSVLKDLGDLIGAKEQYERALKIKEQVYGPDHPAVAITVNNIGTVLNDLGDSEGARKCFMRAENISGLQGKGSS